MSLYYLSNQYVIVAVIYNDTVWLILCDSWDLILHSWTMTCCCSSVMYVLRHRPIKVGFEKGRGRLNSLQLNKICRSKLCEKLLWEAKRAMTKGYTLGYANWNIVWSTFGLCCILNKLLPLNWLLWWLSICSLAKLFWVGCIPGGKGRGSGQKGVAVPRTGDATAYSFYKRVNYKYMRYKVTTRRWSAFPAKKIGKKSKPRLVLVGATRWRQTKPRL